MMNLGKFAERLMIMDDTTWHRHSNPWSGWSRVTILPLLCLAIWSRVWFGWGALWLVLAVIAWTWINPRLFDPPKHNQAWMTKADLAERVWLAQKDKPIPVHDARIARILSIVVGIGLVILAYGLLRLDSG